MAPLHRGQRRGHHHGIRRLRPDPSGGGHLRGRPHQGGARGARDAHRGGVPARGALQRGERHDGLRLRVGLRDSDPDHRRGPGHHAGGSRPPGARAPCGGRTGLRLRDYATPPTRSPRPIASIKELSGGRTIVVFGCGGNRDATKRPIMGAAALAADYAVVTSDNPRHEEPDAIIADIVAGMGRRRALHRGARSP